MPACSVFQRKSQVRLALLLIILSHKKLYFSLELAFSSPECALLSPGSRCLCAFAICSCRHEQLPCACLRFFFDCMHCYCLQCLFFLSKFAVLLRSNAVFLQTATLCSAQSLIFFAILLAAGAHNKRSFHFVAFTTCLLCRKNFCTRPRAMFFA